MKIVYRSNYSGGTRWLTDQNWRDLEAAGWTVEWYRDRPKGSGLSRPDAQGRVLDALASKASRNGLSLGEAKAEWMCITQLDPEEEGCNCCGEPHYFYEDFNYDQID